MLFSLSIMAAIAYTALAALIFFAQSSLIYYPESGRNLIETPGDRGLGYESVEIPTSDGETLHGWFIPVPAAAGAVLFFHGNAGNISHRMDYLLMFHRLGYNTLIFDYRGYGQSSGSPSESGTYLDAQAAWRYLTEAKGVPPARIVLFGESLGGAVAAWLAMSEKPGALVLASVFTSVPDMAAKIYPFLPVRLLSRFDYTTIEYLRTVTCPVFVAHSSQDDIVPFAHGRALYQAAPEPKQFLELQGGHNSGFIFMREDWVEALGKFIDTHLNASS
ncbi:alpha/beta hydrolase [Nitrosospira lacus]|uniref:Alpha/beta hydrolase n=2 Tax=Nitrosospira lacus TaxID=1288494 RepID=A0A1W6SS91_9PROT|nr:alpha/beta hydrolase [Nitrosospira lacus]